MAMKIIVTKSAGGLTVVFLDGDVPRYHHPGLSRKAAQFTVRGAQAMYLICTKNEAVVTGADLLLEEIDASTQSQSNAS